MTTCDLWHEKQQSLLTSTVSMIMLCTWSIECHKAPSRACVLKVSCVREPTQTTSLNMVQQLLTHSLPVKLKLRGYVVIRDFVDLLDIKFLAPVSTVIGMISSSCQRPRAGLCHACFHDVETESTVKRSSSDKQATTKRDSCRSNRQCHDDK